MTRGHAQGARGQVLCCPGQAPTGEYSTSATAVAVIAASQASWQAKEGEASLLCFLVRICSECDARWQWQFVGNGPSRSFKSPQAVAWQKHSVVLEKDCKPREPSLHLPGLVQSSKTLPALQLAGRNMNSGACECIPCLPKRTACLPQERIWS